MDSNYFLSANGELYHAGIKGMKWGVRRYQNKDGTLTDAGKKRYANKEDISKMSDQELRSKINRMNLEKRYVNLSKNNGSRIDDASLITSKSANIGSDAVKIAKKGYEIMDKNKNNLELAGQGFNVASKTAQGVKKISNIAEDKRVSKKLKTKLESMTDKDLQEIVNRMDLEQQYSSLNRETISRGKMNTMDVLDLVGTIVSIGASASVIAVSIHNIKKGKRG